MNDTLKTINNRRSIRSYKADQIPDADLQEILDAAILAPNAMNQQKWHFSVIQDQALLDRMVEEIKANIAKSDNDFLIERASVPGYHTFYHAPVVVVISADDQARWTGIDCGAAAQTIALAATSLGIGSCLITSSEFAFAADKSQEFEKAIGIPQGYSHVCSVALGYTQGEVPATPPRATDVINYVR